MPTVAKGLIWAVVIALVVVALFLWVFPWVESLQQNPTMARTEAPATIQVAREPR